jgi:transcriptional regulator with XRE-family HTH domain
MDLRQSLAIAIKAIRKDKGLTQEDFAVVSSRTYLSTLERGLKSPTLDKLEQLADVLQMHPAAIVMVAYAMQSKPAARPILIDEISEQAKHYVQTSKSIATSST